MLTAQQRSILRAKTNALKTNVNIGKQGVTANVIDEISVWLWHNEVVKIGLLRSCEGDVRSIANQICQQIDCDCVQTVGSKAILYKLSDKKEIEHIL